MKRKHTVKLPKVVGREREEVAVAVTRQLCLLMFSLLSPVLMAQNEPVYKKKSLGQTDVQLLLSYYNQEGDHAAVTAGKGDERLSVYSNKLGVRHKIDSFNTYTIDTQIDIISSASTDAIDFRVSSASKKDIHGVLRLGYERNIPGSDWEWGTNGRISVESDYFSHGLGLWFGKESPDKSRYFSLDFKYFRDDLRWGRKIHRPFNPQFLIYPSELRGVAWFDRHIRNSYNLSASWRHDINKKMNITFFPYLSIQHGLLSTPFHRITFSNSDEVRVENLPIHKIKQAIGIQYNTIVGDRTAMRSFYRYYSDSFGVRSNTVNLQSSIKISSVFWSSFFYRVYNQSASRYFKPYGTHDINTSYYVSDYDLSDFWAHKLGFGMKYYPFKRILFFRKASIRYSRYWRTDGLSANMISSVFDL